ncbi:MarR family winged helix-turn-helix transcriptional regulator [Sphingobacterium populi]|uniref:MarR family winged helix-turn-helix transcriptional regulator n=1 Tax=Sphingobacterium sp. CFCC 11742 TaxID=1775560 RepID=UPI00082F47D2|nr:MarR family transcriptional regulator [Sphingobacterium sp. CFCC 11742]
MNVDKNKNLKLDNQLCFPIYALARDIIAAYRPLLEAIDLTYPQYLALLVLWEKQEQSVSQLGEHLDLDSGTLTPLLKRLEQKGLVNRRRSGRDERIVLVSLTEAGTSLQSKAANIPATLLKSMPVTAEELETLQRIICKIRKNIHKT